MKEVSIILKDNTILTIEEFRIIDRYAHDKIRTLIYRPPGNKPYVFTQKTIEYIFDIESLTFFLLVSQNVLAFWDSDLTKYLKANDEYNIRDYLFIKPFDK